MNFDPLLDTQELEAASHGRVLDCVVAANILNFGIGNAAVILEERG
jgi:hypothetical protein